ELRNCECIPGKLSIWLQFKNNLSKNTSTLGKSQISLLFINFSLITNHRGAEDTEEEKGMIRYS
ncbi:hypothetical protein, partial [Nodularia sp. UHCC 0506]|uniref:hypothetical protein n=1 Tax=Nodularia sp. UHCC 0506 TaxID=3110243 RepID=UPI002B2084D3